MIGERTLRDRVAGAPEPAKTGNFRVGAGGSGLEPTALSRDEHRVRGAANRTLLHCAA